MGLPTPKQFLPLGGKAIVLHSLELLLSMPEVAEVIVVCEAEYRPLFAGYDVHFADAGSRRQDSMANGLTASSSALPWVLVHDSARPFITQKACLELIRRGKEVGAATLGVPVIPTIKEITPEGIVRQTLDRNRLVEIQTPQLLRRELLVEGLARAEAEQWSVTDDVSIAERLGAPVVVVTGEYSNIKITTPHDLEIATRLWQDIVS